jgi:hypothetical protein
MIEQPTPMMIAEFLHHAYDYIETRRPYESWTLAILNEKRFDIIDADIAAYRAKQVN